MSHAADREKERQTNAGKNIIPFMEVTNGSKNITSLMEAIKRPNSNIYVNLQPKAQIYITWERILLYSSLLYLLLVQHVLCTCFTSSSLQKKTHHTQSSHSAGKFTVRQTIYTVPSDNTIYMYSGIASGRVLNGVPSDIFLFYMLCECQLSTTCTTLAQ